MARDPYQVLGVKKGATEGELKSAYRRLAKELHPDRNKDDAKAAERFKEVSSAYALLEDGEKRAKYDRGEIDGDGNPKGFQPGPGFGGGAGGFGFRPSGGGGSASFEYGGDPGDLFSELFGGKRAPFGFDARGGRAPKGGDTAYKLTVAFEAAARLDPQRVQLSAGRALDIKLPAGFESGATIRLAGQGEPGPGGAGDAMVTLEIGPHAHFRREGDDVRLELPVRLDELVLGAKVTAPTVDGAISLAIPAGSAAGRVLRLRGRGFHKKGGGRGDQLVALRVDLPGDDPALRAFCEAWASEKQRNPRAALGVD